MMDYDVWHKWIVELLALWRAQRLGDRVRVSISSRLRRSVATSTPERLEIRLRADVPALPLSVQREILAHELAHIVVFARDPSAPAHGKQWQKLLLKAGYEAHTHIGLPGMSAPRPEKPSRPQWVYVHSCPVCQSERTAGRPMRNWRCRPCTESGLAGTLVILRRRRST